MESFLELGVCPIIKSDLWSPYKPIYFVVKLNYKEVFACCSMQSVRHLPPLLQASAGFQAFRP